MNSEEKKSDIPQLQLGKVAFGNSCAYIVQSKEYISAFRNQINAFCRLSEKNVVFPASLPWTLDHATFSTKVLPYQNDIMWSPKADGRRYYFFITSLFRYTEHFQILIDRSWKMWLVKMNAPLGMYDGTLIDGELVKDKHGVYHFLAFDILVSCGMELTLYSFHNRRKILNRIEPLLESIDGVSPFQFKVKPFYPTSTLGQVCEKPILDLLGVDCKVDGLILSKMHDKICLFSDKTSWKWKPKYYNTIDFFVFIDTNDAASNHVKLFSHDDKTKRPVLFTSQTLEQTNACSRCRENKQDEMDDKYLQLNLLPKPSDIDIAVFDKQVVEFYCCPFNQENSILIWHPVASRSDKKFPNRFSVAQEIYKVISESELSFKQMADSLHCSPHVKQ